MANWTMAKAKNDLERGLLKELGIEALPLDRGWAILIESRLGMDGSGWLVDARSKQPREFKTLDAAVRALAQIGFEVAHLVCHSPTGSELSPR